jgi:Tfp pilus assembly pilus retraction ATPase PilT
MIRDNRLHELTSTLDTSGSMMQSMDRSLASLVISGALDLETAELHVVDSAAFTEFMRTRRIPTPLDDIDFGG